MNEIEKSPDNTGSPPRSTHTAALRKYVEDGICIIPIPHKSKAPKIKDWQNLKVTVDNVEEHFGDTSSNVGVLLGASGLADVDLDAPEAVLLASAILPKTRTFGRASKPDSHYIYNVLERRILRRFQIPGDAGTETLVEYRDSSKDGTSVQTVFPPSTHPSGEDIRWNEQSGEGFTEVEAEALMSAVQTLAFTVVVLRLWPRENGGRHDISGALGSVLARAGLEVPLDVETIGRIVYAIAKAAGDSEPGDRATYAKASAEKARDDSATTGIPTLTSLLCSTSEQKTMLGKALEWIGHGPSAQVQSADAQSESGPGGRESMAALVVRSAVEQNTEFWRDQAGTAYLTYRTLANGEHMETYPLQSGGAETFLRHLSHLKLKKLIRSNDLSDALAQMGALCHFEGKVRETAVRVATVETDGERRLYLDLGNAAWDVVEIRPGQWSVISHTDCPVRMVRSPGALALPDPARGVPIGGALQAVKGLLNIQPADLPLVMGWLVGALYPIGEMAILAFSGEQGTGKSSAAKAIRSFIDPNTVPLRAVSRNEHEAFISATNTYVACYDNVSSISDASSDVMCRISSGGGYAVRAMYTNGQEDMYQVKRPQLLTGITDVVSRGDLAERTIPVTLQRIEKFDRRNALAIESALKAAQPIVLGGLLDAVADGLKRLPSVSLAERPRLGDLAEFVTACEPALGLKEGAFLKAYAKSRKAMVEAAVEDDPVAEAVCTYVGNGGAFEGTAADLLEMLEISQGYAAGSRGGKPRPPGWPRTPRGLSGHLRRAAPALRDLGFEVELDRRTPDRDRKRIVRLAPPPNRKVA